MNSRRDSREPRATPRRSAGRSATTLLGARMISAITGWIGTLIIARKLSAGEWGAYAFILGLLGIIGLAVDLQVGRIVLRAILDAGDAAGRVVGSYVMLRLTISAVAYAFAVAFVVLGGYEREVVWGTVIAGFSFLAVGPANGLMLWFSARLQLFPAATSWALGALAQFALVVAFALAGRGTVVAFALAVLLGEFVNLAWEVVSVVRHRMRVRLTIDLTTWWTWLKESIPLAIGFGLVSLYLKLDLVMLAELDTLTAVGRYGIGYKFADLAGYLPQALLTPVLTLMVTAWPDNAAAIRKQFRQSFVLLFVAAVAIGGGFALVAPHVIELLYGARYASSADAARLLVAGAGLQFFSYLCFVTLISVGRNRPYALVGLLGLVLNAALNFALIPSFSFNGSAAATVITEIVVMALLFAALSRTRGVVTIPWSVMGRTLAAGAVMVTLYLLVHLVAPWPVAAASAAVAFLGALHLLGADGPGGIPALLRNARFDHDLVDATGVAPNQTSPTRDR